ncbi:MAG: ATP-binding cassette domain-containing protein, partial [Kocuria sp.]|nr:ATP-binding cassette domain-containing protein [Kocuria sp.]
MITLDSISRSFGDKQVLHDLSFSIGSGRMTGFVGSNGSGKTTTMRIILGVLAA